MVEEIFAEVYDKFKLNFYKNIFQGFAKRESSLTATETFCVEVIHALDRPTINQLGRFLELSQPNIAYKVNNLVKKGYVRKIQSEEDKREYFLEVTEKFEDYYDIKNEYMIKVLERAREKFSKEEMEQFENILKTMSEELMPEITEGMKKY